MYIISLNYKVDLSVMDEARPKHIEWLKSHYDTGLFIASGRKIPPTGGIILCRSISRSKLEGILSTDPFATQNLATYEIIEFDPVMTCPKLSGIK